MGLATTTMKASTTGTAIPATGKVLTHRWLTRRATKMATGMLRAISVANKTVTPPPTASGTVLALFTIPRFTTATTVRGVKTFGAHGATAEGSTTTTAICVGLITLTTTDTRTTDTISVTATTMATTTVTTGTTTMGTTTVTTDTTTMGTTGTTDTTTRAGLAQLQQA